MNGTGRESEGISPGSDRGADLNDSPNLSVHRAIEDALGAEEVGSDREAEDALDDDLIIIEACDDVPEDGSPFEVTSTERSPSVIPSPVSPPALSRKRTPPRDPAQVVRARIGQVLAGRYRIEAFVARGGMGCVFRATQMPLGRKVAIKIVVPTDFDPEFRRRFFLEASVCARLTHRNIVTVYDYGEAPDGEMFMAMEYLEGTPLSRVLAEERRLPADRACHIAIQCARALSAAHRMGVVHRDLKPGNIFLMEDPDDESRRDVVKVLDFGLVKLVGGDPEDEETGGGSLTQPGVMLGSPKYMSPEQIRTQTIGPGADIYALGGILFHLLAGRPPFLGETPLEILTQHLKTRPPSITEVSGRQDIDVDIEAIAQRCLAKSPSDRFSSMDEVLARLKAVHRSLTGESLGTMTMAADNIIDLVDEIRAKDPTPVAPPRSKSKGGLLSCASLWRSPFMGIARGPIAVLATTAFVAIVTGVLVDALFLGTGPRPLEDDPPKRKATMPLTAVPAREEAVAADPTSELLAKPVKEVRSSTPFKKRARSPKEPSISKKPGVSSEADTEAVQMGRPRSDLVSKAVPAEDTEEPTKPGAPSEQGPEPKDKAITRPLDLSDKERSSIIVNDREVPIVD